jgi:preprotein translocase subunit YajC
MNNLLLVLLQDAGAAAGAAEGAPKMGGGWSMWVMLALIFVVMYFFMIAPQRKQQKELQKYRSGLKKGDKVVTIGGIYGEIVEVSEDEPTVLVKVDGDVKIRFDKNAIQNPGAPQQR